MGPPPLLGHFLRTPGVQVYLASGARLASMNITVVAAAPYAPACEGGSAGPALVSIFDSF